MLKGFHELPMTRIQTYFVSPGTTAQCFTCNSTSRMIECSKQISVKQKVIKSSLYTMKHIGFLKTTDSKVSKLSYMERRHYDTAKEINFAQWADLARSGEKGTQLRIDKPELSQRAKLDILGL